MCVVALDHLTKWLVTAHLALGQQVPASWPVTIRYVENSGAAFGLFPQFHFLYLVVAAIVCTYIIFFGHRFGDGV